MSGKYRLLLTFWSALFLVSALILFVSLQSFRGGSGGKPPKFPGNGSEIDPGGPGELPEGELPEDDAGAGWSLILSIVSALISAAGFMATTYFAMRNDRRQSVLTDLEIQKLANEIERQRLEIDQLRHEQQEIEERQE